MLTALISDLYTCHKQVLYGSHVGRPFMVLGHAYYRTPVRLGSTLQGALLASWEQRLQQWHRILQRCASGHRFPSPSVFGSGTAMNA